MASPDTYKLLIKTSKAIIQAADVKYDVVVSSGEVGIILGSAIA